MNPTGLRPTCRARYKDACGCVHDGARYLELCDACDAERLSHEPRKRAAGAPLPDSADSVDSSPWLDEEPTQEQRQ